MQEIPILGSSFWIILKIGIILGLLVYIVFAVVVLRQVSLMTETLELGHEKGIKALSKAHLIFSIAVLFFALVIL